MKKVFIAIFMFLPMMMPAQNVLTPQQQLEQAQKQLEEAKKAVEAAEKAKKDAEDAAKKAAAAKQAAEKSAAEKAAAEKVALEKAQIEKQIEAAKAEAARLNAEAEKLKKLAENLEKNAIQKTDELEPSISHEPAVLPAIGGKPVVVGEPEKKTEEKKTTTSGWAVPTTPAPSAKKVETESSKLASGVKLKADPKYLEGAVTLNDDGKVEFTMETDANGKSAAQIYDIVYNYMSGLTQDKNNIASRVALVNPQEHVIANTMDEWIVFSQSFISLDRTEIKYQLVANIADNSLKLKMTRLYYNYEEGRSTGFKDAAENVITDKIALTKKRNGLAKIFGKFRKGTINRKDQIFSEIAELVKK